MRPRAWLFALAISLAPTGAQAKGSDADKLYKAGVELLKKGDVQGAVDRFRLAVELERTAPLLFNLGQATAKLGKLSEAKQILEEARQVAQERGPKSIVELADSALAELDKRMPKLILELPDEAKDARVELDGKPFEASREGTSIEPGQHELSVMAEGFEPYRHPFTVKEKDRHRVSPELEARATTHKAPEQDQSKAQSITGPLVLGGAGVLALAGATYFYLKMGSIDDERRQVWAEAGCPGPKCPSSEPQKAADLRKDSESKARLGNVLAVAGGALLISGGVWYYLASRSPSKEQPAAQLTLTPALGGAVLSGRF
jgi:tetratricopeptide (TPR) repeat protein